MRLGPTGGVIARGLLAWWPLTFLTLGIRRVTGGKGARISLIKEANCYEGGKRVTKLCYNGLVLVHHISVITDT
jgi:hypothetical protein